MAIVNCPFCNYEMIDDGQFAGLVVSCPACTQQFQMPANMMVLNRQPQQPHYVPQMRVDVRAKGPSPGLILGGVAALVAIIVGAVLLIDELRWQNNKRHAKEAMQEVRTELRKTFDAIDEISKPKPLPPKKPFPGVPDGATVRPLED